MKIQLQQQQVRVRIDEQELAQLFDAATLCSRSVFPGGVTWALQLRLHAEDSATLHVQAGDILLALPQASVHELAQRLPCRDGVVFSLSGDGAPLTVHFDVDVRDSVRERGVVRGSTRAAGGRGAPA